MEASNSRPPLTVRTNRLRTSPENLAARLREEMLAGIQLGRLAPEALLVSRGDSARAEAGPPGRGAAFMEGWCTVQDEASMLVARLLDPKPGERVADCCAAPGTKTTHVAELMEDRGSVIAVDPQAARLALLDRATARLGISIVKSHVGSIVNLATRWPGQFDRVLVDAPCSNLGVLRRNPEVKWRRTENDVRRLQERQRDILAAGASMVRSGGYLVYATCSPEPDENEDVVLPFLEAHPGWRADAPEGFPVPPDAQGFVRLLPHRHGTDGFVVIRLLHARDG